jgi:hypothetical protein
VASLKEDGNEALAKFLIQHKLVNEDVVASALERVQKKNRDLAPNTAATSLIDEIIRRGGVELETLLLGHSRPVEVRLHPARILRRRSANRKDAARIVDPRAGSWCHSMS